MTVSRALNAARLSRQSAWGWYMAAGALVTLLYDDGAAGRRQRPGDERPRALVLGGDRARHRVPPAAAPEGLGVLPGRAAPVLHGRRLHVQPERAVPVARRRALPGRVPGAHGRPRAARPAPKPDLRPGRPDRLAHPVARHRPPVVGLSGRAVHQPERHDRPRQGRVDGLPARRRAAARRGDPPRGRHRPPAAGVLPARLEHRVPARHGLGLQLHAAQGHLRPPGPAGRGLDCVLPPVGRRGAPPLDADARGARAGSGACA